MLAGMIQPACLYTAHDIPEDDCFHKVARLHQIGGVQFHKTNTLAQPFSTHLFNSPPMHKCCIYGELIHLLIPYTHGLCSVSSRYSLKSKFTQKLVLITIKKENWGSLERAVCSAPRMTGELPSPLAQTPCARVLSSDTVCPPTPAKLAHISTLHWELHTADWESVRLLRNWHTSALHSSLLH